MSAVCEGRNLKVCERLILYNTSPPFHLSNLLSQLVNAPRRTWPRRKFKNWNLTKCEQIVNVDREWGSVWSSFSSICVDVGLCTLGFWWEEEPAGKLQVVCIAGQTHSAIWSTAASGQFWKVHMLPKLWIASSLNEGEQYFSNYISPGFALTLLCSHCHTKQAQKMPDLREDPQTQHKLTTSPARICLVY